MKLFRWLRPGVHVKRWLFLFGIGMMITSFGLILTFNYEWIGALEEWTFRMLYEVTGHYNYTVLASSGIVILLAGLLVMGWTTRRLVRNMLSIVMPGESGNFSDLILENLKLSKGRIRQDLDMIAPGDLRNCLVAMADKEGLMEKLFDHRFGGSGNLSGHSFGNLFIAALIEVLGDAEGAMDATSKILKIRGNVIPSSAETILLNAEMTDGTVVQGESQIPLVKGKIKRVFTTPAEPKAVTSAIQAIREADAIVLGPGSLYTSIMPNLLIPDIAAAIRESEAKKIYICNVMTQPGETDGYSVSDHVAAINRHAGAEIIDFVLANNGAVEPAVLQHYAEAGQQPVRIDKKETGKEGATVILADLVSKETGSTHDPKKLATVLFDLINALRSDLSPQLLNYYLKRYNRKH